MRGGRAFMVGAAVLVAATAAWANLDFGEKPPDLDIVSWVQGDAVTIDKLAGKPVVLEFLSSTSDPCKKAVPKLAKLAEKNKDALEVIAVSDEKADDLKAFVADGKLKGVRVACDSERNTSGPYLQSFHGKLPYAVVLDKAGAVVWKGEPAAGLERAVGRVLSGKLDGAKAKSIAEMQATVEESLMLKNFPQAFGDADKLLEADPSNEKGITAKLKHFQKEKEAAKCKAFVEKILPQIDDDAAALNLVAWELATCEEISMREPGPALKAARRAVERSESADAAILDTLARAQFECGLVDQAIETQKKAVAVPDTEEKLAEKIKATLDYYVACAEARKTDAEPASGK